MFVADTQIFSNSGWKKIQDIKGNDKVLVKNFIGDAEFIQPFAIKKKQYEGEVFRLGAKDWSFTVTPDHKNLDDKQIVRRFKYMFSDEPQREIIKIFDEFGTRNVTISQQDWYKLVGLVLMRGFIKTGYGRPMLMFYLEEERIEEETKVLSDIFDRIGVPWHVQYSEKTKPKFVVSSKNTIAARLATRLGSTTRKDMYLPNKMIYSSTKELATLLIETIITYYMKPGTERRSVVQIATTNKKLIDSLTILGTLSGYSIRSILRTKAGTPVLNGFTQKDIYNMQISNINAVYSFIYRQKSLFSGYVYGIDLFDGQVYVKDGAMPVWVSPK